MSFFKSKNKLSYTLSISLKSSSIDLQLIQTNSLNKKEVLFVEQKTLFLENSQDPELYTQQYSKELEALLLKNHTQLKQLIQHNPLEIKFVLYTPWFTSTIISATQKEEVVLNEEFLSKKIQEIPVTENLKNLEKRILKIEANGYTIHEMKHAKTSNIELDAYLSYISNPTHKLLEDSVKKYFPKCAHITLHTSPLLFLDTIKRFLVREDNIIFIHVDNEITEVGIIEEDSLVYFVTFPIGIHDFIRNIQLNVKSYDYDLLYQKEIQMKSDTQKTQFEILKKNWEGSIIQSLELFKNNIPNKVVLLTNSKTKKFFTELLINSTKSSQKTILNNHRMIDFDISLLKDIITYKTPVGENELQLKLEALI